jgi:hypothetical protein
MFVVIFEMIGRVSWLMVPLGSFTAYISFISSDILFAAVFVTAIWQLKQHRFWIHLLLLAIASLIRPSLAWIFLVYPAVMYFYNYRGRIVYWSLILVFVATSFNAARNLVNHGQWIHTSILSYNIHEIFEKSPYPMYLQVIDNFKINFHEPHWAFSIDKNKIDKLKWAIIAFPFVVINSLLWLNLFMRIRRKEVNWGDILLLTYIITPTFLAPTFGRIRLPIEWILL